MPALASSTGAWAGGAWQSPLSGLQRRILRWMLCQRKTSPFLCQEGRSWPVRVSPRAVPKSYPHNALQCHHKCH
jgi:hypothetical protein